MANVLVEPLKSNRFMGCMWIVAQLSGYQGSINRTIIKKVYHSSRNVIRPDIFCPRLRQAAVNFHHLDRKDSIDLNSAILVADAILNVRESRHLELIEKSVSDLPDTKTASSFKGQQLMEYEDQVIKAVKNLMSISELQLLNS